MYKYIVTFDLMNDKDEKLGSIEQQVISAIELDKKQQIACAIQLGDLYSEDDLYWQFIKTEEFKLEQPVAHSESQRKRFADQSGWETRVLLSPL